MTAEILILSETKTATAQQIYLAPDGRILSSDDSIFDTEMWEGVSVLEIFPVLESCHPYFYQPDNFDFREFQLPGVQLPRGKTVAYFDFYFLKIWYESREAIFWWMEDRSKFYRQKQYEQQKRYDAILGY